MRLRHARGSATVLVWALRRCAAHLAQGGLAFIVIPGLTWRSKGRAASVAVLKFCNLLSFGVLFSVRERHAP